MYNMFYPGENQNKTTTQIHNDIPPVPGYQKLTEKPFESMLTPEDQIHWLYSNMQANNLTPTDLKPLWDQINIIIKRLDGIDADIIIIYERLKNLEDKLNSFADGAMSYDVTQGMYAPSIISARRKWQASSPWGMTVAELANFKIEDIEDWGCLAISIAGRYLYDNERELTLEELAQFIINSQESQTFAKFMPDDYIKRSELEQIDVNNLNGGTIYGIPKQYLPDPPMPPMPFTRHATVKDLHNALIMYNGHFITDKNKESK